MTYDFTGTGIPNNYACNLKDKYMMNWIPNSSAAMFRVMFTTIGTYLKTIQTKTVKKTVLSIDDSNGEFLMGAIMEYHAPEEGDDEDKGNWTLDLTFDKKDCVDADEYHNNQCDAFFIIASNESLNTLNGRFKNSEICNNMFCEAVRCIKDCLDGLATPDEPVEVTLPGIFTASVSVVKGSKVMSIVPGEVVRQLVKGDSIM